MLTISSHFLFSSPVIQNKLSLSLTLLRCLLLCLRTNVLFLEKANFTYSAFFAAAVAAFVRPFGRWCCCCYFTIIKRLQWWYNHDVVAWGRRIKQNFLLNLHFVSCEYRARPAQTNSQLHALPHFISRPHINLLTKCCAAVSFTTEHRTILVLSANFMAALIISVAQHTQTHANKHIKT